MSDNREDKIQFIRDDLNKESLDDILLSLETHPSGYVQGAILQLWPLFQKEHARYSCCANFNVLASARIYCSID